MLMNIYRIFGALVLLCFFTATKLHAQQPADGFSREILSGIEKKLNDKKVSFHSNIQPGAVGFDSLFSSIADTNSSESKNHLTVRPIYNISGGFQAQDSAKPVFGGFAGLETSWRKNDRWFANAGYTLNGGSPANYIISMAATERFLPGSGYAVNDGNDLFHSHYTYGRFAYNEGKHFHFEIGKGKHFWGDGYRSLILSDNSSSFPYARITTNVWKLRYTNLWMQLKDISFGQARSQARTKYAAMHALSLNATNKLNISIYELVVWQDRDSMNKRTLDINYLNPIIFYRPVEYSVGSPDNVILATSMKYKINKNMQFYGQFVLDEFNLKQFRLKKKWWANKIAGQIGFKYFDIIPGLSFQTEANIARPFIYTHGSSVQGWTHLNQPVAHPLGANFIEWANFIRFEKNDWHLIEQFNWSGFGRDYDVDGNGIAENFGGNITRSYRNPYDGQYGHEMLQGLKSTFLFNSFTLARKIKSIPGSEVFFNHVFRYEKTQINSQIDHFFSVGVKLSGLLSPAIDY